MHGSNSSRRRKLGTGSIALSLGLCLCAGQMVAVQPATAAPVTATPVLAAAAKVKPTVKLAGNRKWVYYGSPVKLTAKVTNSKTKKAVTSGMVRLQRYVDGAWRPVINRNVNKTGAVAFTIKPLGTATYRTVYVGNGSVTAGTSNGWRMTVKNSGAKIVAEAAKHKGALYLFGGSGPSRFDCSGFTMYVYRKSTGRKLPHNANSQQGYGKAVSNSKKAVGDLIVYRSGSYGYHTAIYAGGGYMWDSPTEGKRVSKRKMFSGSYVTRRLI